MTLEELMAKGLSKEHAEIALKAHKDAINGNFIPKATFDAEREKLKATKELVDQKDTQIKELEKFKGTAEELQAKISSLTQTNADIKTQYEEKIKNLEESSAIRAAILDKVHNPEDILSKIDRTKIMIRDGRVESGLDDQIDLIKKDFPHYFKEAPAEGWLPHGWSIFGRTPEDHREQGGSNFAEDFGRALAKSQVTGDTTMQKAEEIYFK